VDVKKFYYDTAYRTFVFGAGFLIWLVASIGVFANLIHAIKEHTGLDQVLYCLLALVVSVPGCFLIAVVYVRGQSNRIEITEDAVRSISVFGKVEGEGMFSEIQALSTRWSNGMRYYDIQFSSGKTISFDDSIWGLSELEGIVCGRSGKSFAREGPVTLINVDGKG
jgi:hypothetical protein